MDLVFIQYNVKIIPCRRNIKSKLRYIDAFSSFFPSSLLLSPTIYHQHNMLKYWHSIRTSNILVKTKSSALEILNFVRIPLYFLIREKCQEETEFLVILLWERSHQKRYQHLEKRDVKKDKQELVSLKSCTQQKWRM